MAEEKKKIPKLPPKKKTNLTSTPNKQKDAPKKPTTAPSKSSNPPAKSNTPQQNKDPPKQSSKPAQPSSRTSTPPVKPTDASSERKPSLAPTKGSTSGTKPAQSPAPSTARRPSTAPRKASVPPSSAPGTSSDRKPSIAPRKASTPAVKPSTTPQTESVRASKPTDTSHKAKPSDVAPDKTEDQSSAPSPAVRPSVPPRKESGSANKQTDTDQKRKPPKLGPRKTSDQSPASSQSRRPSLTHRKSSTAKPATGGTKGKDAKEEDEDTPAHKVAEEEKDLKSFLSESERADLTLLVAGISETMRKTIESNFDAAATLKDLGQAGQSEEDRLANIDYDPGTVDVTQYDKESKAREEREKELATPKVKELKKNALKWFDDWREVVIQRVGEAVNSKETTSKQKEKTSTQGSKTTTTPITEGMPVQKIDTGAKQGEYRPPKLEQLFPRIQTPLTKLPMQKRTLVLHSILLILLSLEHYNAASRVLLLYLTSSLKLGLNNLRDDEEKTAKGLLEAAKQIQADQELLKKTTEESENSRKWKIRLAQMAGAAVVGISGGMAAPMVS